MSNWERKMHFFYSYPDASYAGSEPKYVTDAKKAGRKAKEEVLMKTYPKLYSCSNCGTLWPSPCNACPNCLGK